MRIVVTGVAGFIGSTIAEEAVRRGHEVVGIDSETGNYDRALKLANLAPLLTHRQFSYHKIDVRDSSLAAVLAGADAVLHQAGEPGVRNSWAHLAVYLENNIQSTNDLLAAAKEAGIPRIVHASSSSVYGNAKRYPVKEDDSLEPFSPYGVTKLAAENLVRTYAYNFGMATLCLRYFTVYGPKQRPDMAIQRMLTAADEGSTFTMFGDGSQVRDFTFVHDIARANLAALESDAWQPGDVANLAGGAEVSMRDLVHLIEEVSGRVLDVQWSHDQMGDVSRTGGDVSRARELLGWTPQVGLLDGLTAQWEWITKRSGTVL